jgi:hypothetical protein
MTRKKALLILRLHKGRLSPIAAHDYDHLYLWQREALTYVGTLLGVDSEPYKLIQSFQFPTVQEENYDRTIAILKSRLEECMNQAIETIKNIGVLQKTYHTFLCRYSDKELLAYIIPIASAIFGAGVFIGRWLTTH